LFTLPASGDFVEAFSQDIILLRPNVQTRGADKIEREYE
jgi:hypothetical protein